MRALLSKLFILLLLVASVAACGRQEPVETLGELPTVAPIFDEAPVLRATPTARPASLPTRLPTASARPTVEPVSQTVDLAVYDEGLTTGWNLSSSFGMRYDAASEGTAYRSDLAVEGIPTKAFGGLIFGVARSAPRNYKRADVLGVRFRVSGGEAIIPNDGLIVTVYGSKKYPYFVPGDISATPPEGRTEGEQPLFPETRLYFLEVNRAIEPGEWAEVFMWLDEHYTPDYTYVTGIQIKNDEFYMDPFYVDDVALIVKQP